MNVHEDGTSYHHRPTTGTRIRDHCWSAVMWALLLVPVLAFVGEM